MKKFKVITVVGTRPEIIRLSRVIEKFDKKFNHVLIHTNQNQNYELNQIFFEDLKLRKPNYILKKKGSTTFSFLAYSLIEVEKIILKEKPDAFLVLGDTNSALTSIVAKKFKIPLFHIEAGNRCFDQNVPEEINRKILDHISDINIVYSSFARRNLIAEGIPNEKLYKLGSPLYEVLSHYTKNLDHSKTLKKYKVKKNNFFLVSFHRNENISNKKNFENFCLILELINKKYNNPILVSTHPGTEIAISKIRKKNIFNKKIFFLKPFSFKEYISLQINAKLIISDSGSITEESSILNLNSISLRNTFERQEGLETSSIIISSLDIDNFEKTLNYKLSSVNKKSFVHEDYNNLDFSENIADIVISKIHYINKYTYHK
tara:strand:+ start:103 stop:1227 length:1125 start_codon:yes stop_codon:yes gene_type:complete